MGLWYYIVPRLTGRKLWSELLGNITVALWVLGTMGGIILLLLGFSQGREYAEMIYAVDVEVMIVLVLNLVNLYMTISKRVEQKLYGSLWYIIGTLIWFPMVYFIGNVMWNPATGSLTGINDSIFNWFYGHNVLGVWFTTGLLAVIYYIVPRETHTPLYSHLLSLISFWGIALFYTGVGGHHLEWAPIPYWLKTLAVAESIGMILVVVAFMSNIWLTMRGNWSKVFSSIPLRFVITGFAAYVLVSYQGTHQALRGINLLTHFTQYVPGHAHLSLLFFAASTVMGGIYYVIPRILNVHIFSRRLANVQYAMYVFGFTFFFAGFLLVGTVQGTSWLHEGLPVWTVLPGLRPYMALRAAGGSVLWMSFLLFAYNVFATVIVRKPYHSPAIPTMQSVKKPMNQPIRSNEEPASAG
jgi:cbb3-type cytochrome c oxidase subunit I